MRLNVLHKSILHLNLNSLKLKFILLFFLSYIMTKLMARQYFILNWIFTFIKILIYPVKVA